MQRKKQKVAEVTTPNLEAYQHYFLGEQWINRLKFKEAEEEFKKAIARDSTFGLAYYRLAYAKAWWNEQPAKELIHKANALIDHIPEKERCEGGYPIIQSIGVGARESSGVTWAWVVIAETKEIFRSGRSLSRRYSNSTK